MDANVTQSWLMARAAGKQMLAQGERRQGRADVVGARPARPSGRLHRLLRVEVGDRRHHQGARLRMGRRPASPSMRIAPTVFRSPLTAWMFEDTENAPRPCARASSRACRRAGSASRPISPGRCCSSPRRRRISTPATSSTPTAATRRADHDRKARIAVVGAGLMGHGIAQVFALAGHDVTITDAVTGSARHRARRASPRTSRDLGDDPAAVERVHAASPISPTAVRDADYRRRGGAGEPGAQAEAVRRDRAARAAATRSSPATPRSSRSPRSCRGCSDRERALGTHWWNPPFLVPLVEVIGTQWTSPAGDRRRRWRCTQTPARRRCM